MDPHSRSLNARFARTLIQAAMVISAIVTEGAAAPADEAAEYRQWISRYESQRFPGLFPDAATAAKLTITAVEGDEPAAQEEIFHRRVEYGTQVTTDGRVSSFSHSSRGTKGGGGGPPLPAETLTRLDELLTRLPADSSRLPPVNRKLLIQAAAGDGKLVRVYDRANAPAVVWEILRLLKSGIGSYVPTFKPASVIEARGHQHGGFLRLTPDGKQLLFTGSNQPLQFWEPATHELLAEVRGLGNSSIVFSPDGSKAVVAEYDRSHVLDTKTWKGTRYEWGSGFAQFTADGRHLLLPQGPRGIKIVDATTWKLVDSLPGLPPEPIRYLPAPKSKRAVVHLKSGGVALWDAEANRVVATLREGARLVDAVFSPDESLVVIKTETGNPGPLATQFGIWRADRGELVHELRPYERAGQESTTGLVWSPDGQYVLAGMIRDWSSENGISVFSARTGKHRGQFAGITRMNGVVLLPDASELVAGCVDGDIRFWDFKDAMAKIREFEASLAPLPGPG